jgi:formylglycine-generating enzyme required for sulfatase activity
MIPHGPLPTGTEIAGHTILRPLGQGGFGIVYEVSHTFLGHRRAMKEFFCSGMSTRTGTGVAVSIANNKPLYDKLLKRFIETGQLLARLDHPALLKVHHIERRDGTAYLFTDYVEGWTLQDWLKSRPLGISETELRTIFEPVMDALAYCHAQGLLHRDIAPDNIMLRRDTGKPVLIDFGAVKQGARESAAEGGGHTSTVAVAKDRFAPIEQRLYPAPEPHGSYTDIFALGATMYCALAGDPPTGSLERRILEADPYRSIAERSRQPIGSATALAIDRALSLKPQQRWQSVAEMKAVLGWSKAEPATQLYPAVPTTLPPPSAPIHQEPPASLPQAPFTPAPPPHPPFPRHSTAPPVPSAPAYPSSLPPRRRSPGAVIPGVLALAALLVAVALLFLRPNPEAVSDAEYAKIEASTSIATFEAFVRTYPGTRAAQRAEQRLAALRAARSGPRILTSAEELALAHREEFQECETCPRMVVVPGGRFQLGSPPEERERSSEEGPLREIVFLRAFAVGKYEVTVDQFEAFVRESGHSIGQQCTFWTGKLETASGSFRSPGFAQAGTHPAVCVSWNDARAYVAWLSRKTGKRYRLLSEAEWEYSARAGTRTRFWWGDEASRDRANYGTDACCNGLSLGPDRYFYTAPVGQFSANSFGLHDLHGNVWEWTEDCYNGTLDGTSTDGSARLTGDCNNRVDRGGSWANPPADLRSARRARLGVDHRGNYLGFRVARTLGP